MYNFHTYDNTIYNRLVKKYSEAKEPYYKIIKKVEEERHNYLNSSKTYIFLLFIKKYQFILYVILLFSFEIIFPSFILAALYLFIFYSTYKKIQKVIPEYENKILTKVGKRWLDLKNSEKYSLDKIEELNQTIEIEYDNICENLSYRPPDWAHRRKKILIRDNYTCTECGWPNGFQRRARELHIHHIKAISRGGDNSLENLTTLCNVCHKKVDKLHHGVRNSRRKPKNK